MSHVQQLREAIRVEQGPASECKRSLLRVIDRQIIPRLSRVHEQADDAGGVRPPSPFTPAPGTVAHFAMLCCSVDETQCMDFIRSLLDEGCALPQVLENLLAPAARFLGEQWDQDRIDFATVAQGLVRMQNITHHFVPLERQVPRSAEDRFSIILAAAPGTTHLLGLTMVEELFTSDGWEVRLELATHASDLEAAVATDWFDVLGLSVGLSEQLDSVPALIAGIRKRSLNPRLGVLLGGHAFENFAEAAYVLGADAICLEPKAAIRTARRMAMQVHTDSPDTQTDVGGDDPETKSPARR